MAGWKFDARVDNFGGVILSSSSLVVLPTFPPSPATIKTIVTASDDGVGTPSYNELVLQPVAQCGRTPKMRGIWDTTTVTR